MPHMCRERKGRIDADRRLGAVRRGIGLRSLCGRGRGGDPRGRRAELEQPEGVHRRGGGVLGGSDQGRHCAPAHATPTAGRSLTTFVPPSSTSSLLRRCSGADAKAMGVRVLIICLAHVEPGVEAFVLDPCAAASVLESVCRNIGYGGSGGALDVASLLAVWCELGRVDARTLLPDRCV